MTRILFITTISIAATAQLGSAPLAAKPHPEVLSAQHARAEAVARASQATIAVFEPEGAGGGSGVLISKDGFALTNFHVVAPCGPAMKCGLPDGKLYDAVIVGIDPVGDVALIQLLGRDDFPAAEIGDSDAVRVGDWVFTAGNPFLLADDFQPSISFGFVSGVHRYQYPAGTLLEYADCLQTDAAINPGNSGGPLFDAEGRLVGINGRGSFEKRGRVNVGVGYAISINQIMRFLSHLKSGRIVDHASFGATVSTQEDGRVVVDDILDSSDAFRRGLRYGDVIVRFAGREIASANALKNVLGVFPPDWRVPVEFRRDGELHQVQVRLAGLHEQAELIDQVQKEGDDLEPPGGDDGDKRPHPEKDGESPEMPRPRKASAAKTDKLPPEVRSRYVERYGYANYWYNQSARTRLWQSYLQRSAIKDVGYRWRLAGKLTDGESFDLTFAENQAECRMPWGKSNAVFTGDVTGQLSPPRSGGLLLAVHAWQRLLENGPQKLGEAFYLGALPHGPDGVVEDCLVTIFDGIELRLFFNAEGDMTGLELYPAADTDPSEVTFSDFGEVGGRRLPRKWHVRHGDEVFADLHIERWDIESPAAAEAREN